MRTVQFDDGLLSPVHCLWWCRSCEKADGAVFVEPKQHQKAKNLFVYLLIFGHTGCHKPALSFTARITHGSAFWKALRRCLSPHHRHRQDVERKSRDRETDSLYTQQQHRVYVTTGRTGVPLLGKFIVVLLFCKLLGIHDRLVFCRLAFGEFGPKRERFGLYFYRPFLYSS